MILSFAVLALWWCAPSVAQILGSDLSALYSDHGCCQHGSDCLIPSSSVLALAELALARAEGHACTGDLVWNECASACDVSCDVQSGDPCIQVCVPKCDCPSGWIRVRTNGDRCVPEHECPRLECKEDGECDAWQWCRPHSQGGMCAPYARLGASCGGYVLAEWEERCAPGISCEARGDPRIADLPGICTDKRSPRACAQPIVSQWRNETRFYNFGESFTRWEEGESCNRCICLDGGIACTERKCER